MSSQATLCPARFVLTDCCNYDAAHSVGQESEGPESEYADDIAPEDEMDELQSDEDVQQVC